MTALSDPLTDVLETFSLPIRLAGRFELAPPWGMAVPAGFAAVCAVQGDGCWLTSDAMGGPILLGSGDVVVLSPVCEHQLRDALGSRVVPIRIRDDGPIGPRLEAGNSAGDGPRTTLLAGVFHVNGGGHPLCGALPEVVHLKRQEAESGLSLGEIARLVDRESARELPGTRGIISRLFEILLVQAIRIWMAKTGGPSTGPIRGMLHPELRNALAAIHRRPDADWTVAGLAEQAGMSRSAFSAAFTRVLGTPPREYLRHRRMDLACRYLRNPSLGLKEVASKVGYESVSAFSSAFKRFSGVSPGAYRRRYEHSGSAS